MTIGALVVLAAIVKIVVDRVRANFPTINGDLVNLVAAVIGVAIAFSAGLDEAASIGLTDLPYWLDVTVTGLTIGLGAGFLNDTLGAIATARTS